MLVLGEGSPAVAALFAREAVEELELRVAAGSEQEAGHAKLHAGIESIGLAFQIQDDLLDIEGDVTVLGKLTGADRALNKPTYPSVAGIDAARSRMHELHSRALAFLQVPGLNPAPLVSISDWLVLRKH